MHASSDRGMSLPAERTPLAAVRQAEPLFPSLPRQLSRDMEGVLVRALDRACPLKQAHRRDLPMNIVQLSRLLTVERAGMRHPYWASPALAGAYVHYFLPWNVYRLSRLFAGLRPQAPGDGPHLLLDLGAGPLTVPIALWLSCPEWRTKQIVVVAVDRAGHPMQTGRAILEQLAAEAGVDPWEMHLVQAPLDQGPRRAAGFVRRGVTPWLVTAANVLNELPPARRQRMTEDAEDDEDDEEQSRDDSRLNDLLISINGLLRRGPEGARALFVEPGTRLGGLTLMGLRSLAREEEMRILGPCTHAGLCPLHRGNDDGLDEPRDDENDDAVDILGVRSEPAVKGAVSRLAGRSWCHFTFTGDGAPGWLRALAGPTGLAKETLSLAWLALGARMEAASVPIPHDSRLRVISQPFPVPGRGQCRYACSAAGLVLLEHAQDIASGTRLTLDVGTTALRTGPEDGRSGAHCLALEGVPSPAHGPRGDQARSGAGRRSENGFGRQVGRNNRSDGDDGGQLERVVRGGRADNRMDRDVRSRPDRSDHDGRDAHADNRFGRPHAGHPEGSERNGHGGRCAGRRGASSREDRSGGGHR